MLEFPRFTTADMPSSPVSKTLTKPALFILSAVASMVGAGEVQAWGFGRAQSSAVLGVPLDFSVALRLDASESPPECLAADVSAGDIPVPRSAVFVSLEGGAGGPVVRVRTTVAIDEPLVTIRLSAGCGSSTSRRFTLLADPPGHLAAPLLAQAESVQPAVPATAAPVVLAATAQAGPATVLSAAAVQADPPRTPGVASPSVTPAADASPTASSSTVRGASGPRARPLEGATALADASAQAAQRAASREPRAKLQLDAPTLMTSAVGTARVGGVATALQSAQDAASAARAAASAAQARAADMQKSIDALRQEAQANREALARLTRALEESQGSTPAWFWAALAALGGLSALMFVRMRRLQAGGAATPWWSASAVNAADVSGPALEKTTAGHSTEVLAPPGSTASAETPTLPTLPALPVMPTLPPDATGEASATRQAQTEPPPPAVEAEAEPDRDALPSVSIDDLLDLQQQAEFFSVLGQEDAALKLLSDHLRQTRGDYPLPYLQLMDTYQRRTDMAGFERVRSRFQQRFGIAWPDGQQPAPGRRHLDDCPELLLDIERVWPNPAQTMVSLEHTLRSADRMESLDPMVQGDLLFLYTLARDLRDQPAQDSAPSPLPVPVPAPVKVAVVSASTSGAVDQSLDLDLDFGPEVDMDQGSAPSAGLDLTLDFEAPPARPAADQLQALPVIDLPLAGAESGLDATAIKPAATLGVGEAAQGGGLDLLLDEIWNPVPAAAPAAPKQGSQALSLEFPDLEVPAAKELAIPQAAAVDLELSFDAQDLAALPPPLSADEQRAASRFSLFSEEFDHMKKR